MPTRALRVVSPLAALVYPWLVALGPGLWRPLLGLALLVPAIAVYASLRLGDSDARAARGVAFAAVGAPALFSLLGGLLDFQRALPVKDLTVWVPLWLVLAAIAWREPAVPRTSTSRGPGRLAIVHGIAALPVIGFALLHVVNHLCGLAGGAVHLRVMHALRGVYRDRLGEPVLLACVAILALTGVALVGRRLARRTTPVETLQTAAGAYMALFFASHVTAVLRARGRGVATDWQWLVGSDLLRDEWSARLVPYYLLAVIALAVHVGCAVRAVTGRRGVLAAATALGAASAVAIIAGLIRGS